VLRFDGLLHLAATVGRRPASPPWVRLSNRSVRTEVDGQEGKCDSSAAAEHSASECELEVLGRVPDDVLGVTGESEGERGPGSSSSSREASRYEDAVGAARFGATHDALLDRLVSSADEQPVDGRGVELEIEAAAGGSGNRTAITTRRGLCVSRCAAGPAPHSAGVLFRDATVGVPAR